MALLLPIAKLAVLLVAGATSIAAAGMALQGVATAATSADESCFIAAINAARASGGRPGLVATQDLTAIARAHAQAMAAAGRLFHNTELASQAPPSWRLLGENIGYGPSCEAINANLVADPAHMANILEPRFNELGVGVAAAGDGQLYVTEDFMLDAAGPSALPATPSPSSPPARADLGYMASKTTVVVAPARRQVPRAAPTPVPTATAVVVTASDSPASPVGLAAPVRRGQGLLQAVLAYLSSFFSHRS